MNLGGEEKEEKETCTGKRPRSHDSTTAWGSSSSDVVDAAGETKNARRREGGRQHAAWHYLSYVSAWLCTLEC